MKRFTALMLSLVMLLSVLPSFFASGAAAEPAVQTVTAPQNRQAVLTAETQAEGLSWQLLALDRWVDIYGAEGNSCNLSYAMAKNVMSEDGSCQVRCVDEEDTVLARYQVTFTGAEIPTPAFTPVFTVLSETEPSPTPSAEPEEQPALFALLPPGEEAAPIAEMEPYMITVEYRNEDGEQIILPWTKVIREPITSQEIFFPDIQGYAPFVDCTFDETQKKWVGGTRQAEITLHLDGVTQDVLVTVIYKPAEVSYFLSHHYQHTTDDQYEKETSLQRGFTGTQVSVEALAKELEGFTAIWFDEPYIMADGSTSVDIYYDRLYYLMKFNLDGGYGTDPIYARYETAIQVPTPQKPGYTFDGWLDPLGKPAQLPATMPAQATEFTAKWKVNPTASATVMIWGENPDKPGTYEYIRSTRTTVDTGGNIDLQQPQLLCGKQEHTHSAACCTLAEHTHTDYCYRDRDKPETNTKGFPADPQDGQVVYEGFWIFKTYYVYHVQYPDSFREFPDRPNNPTGWYRFDRNNYTLLCKTPEHTHGDGKCTCPIPEHTHGPECYSDGMDARYWTFVRQDNPQIEPDGTTVVNGYYDRTSFTIHFRDTHGKNDRFGSITAKWGANIQQRFKEISQSAGTNNWSETKDGKSPWTANVQIMPQKDMIYYRPPDSSGSSTAYYKGLSLRGYSGYPSDYTVPLLTSVANGSNLVVSVEDFLQFDGFTFNLGLSTKERESFDGAVFYYTRNRYELAFQSSGETVRTEQILFEEPLDQYHGYEPVYPSNLEPGGYRFEGWYADPSFLPESKIDWTRPDATMPAYNLTVYAHWVPTVHRVRTFETEYVLTQGMEPLEVLDVTHGEMASPGILPSHEAQNQQFVGWFYRDETGREHAFDPVNMPVRRDLDLYAKWTSRVMVEFCVRYVLMQPDGSEQEIATRLTGKIMAGAIKTFYPKTGPDLDHGYKTKYYPVLSSQTVTMGLDPDRITEIVFVYEFREPPIPYSVRYLEKDTGRVLHPEKFTETLDALVYEDFQPIDGYLPDAYSKKMYISPNDVDNVITFWYVKDTVHAPMRTTHWVQKPDLSGYLIYSEDLDQVGIIGQTYSIGVLSLPGFEENTTHPQRKGEGVLTKQGLHLQRFYDRVPTSCRVSYLEIGTNHPVHRPDGTVVEPTVGKFPAGSVHPFDPLTIEGWDCVNPETYQMRMAVELDPDVPQRNVYTFYYRRKARKINLIIRKSGWDPIDENQSFVFHVKGTDPDTEAVDLEVSVEGNGSVTITDLPPGCYTVTEETGWSWRYQPGQTQYDLDLAQDHILSVDNTRTKPYWYNGAARSVNDWSLP